MRLGLIEVPAAYANVLIESKLSIRVSWQGLHFAIKAKFIQVAIHDIYLLLHWVEIMRRYLALSN